MIFFDSMLLVDHAHVSPDTQHNNNNIAAFDENIGTVPKEKKDENKKISSSGFPFCFFFLEISIMSTHIAIITLLLITKLTHSFSFGHGMAWPYLYAI